MTDDQPEMFETGPAAPKNARPIPDWFHIGNNTPALHTNRVKRGLHPMGMPLGTKESRCGTCRHRKKPWSKYWKCDLVQWTSGAATDIKMKWRGCKEYEHDRD